ncbi:MAG: phospholipase [Gemmatimonadetes bacterium]|nr:phospholipase [Gemmatimonadota bacterium]
MPGSILSFVTPWRFDTILFGVYDYFLPIMLYCGWSIMALLDLSERAEREPGPAAGWSAAVLALPVVGALSYLVAGRSGLSRPARYAVVFGGLGVLAAAYALTFNRIR